MPKYFTMLSENPKTPEEENLDMIENLLSGKTVFKGHLEDSKINKDVTNFFEIRKEPDGRIFISAVFTRKPTPPVDP